MIDDIDSGQFVHNALYLLSFFFAGEMSEHNAAVLNFSNEKSNFATDACWGVVICGWQLARDVQWIISVPLSLKCIISNVVADF